MRLLETLHTAVWAIHPMTAEAYLPLVANILKGNVSPYVVPQTIEKAQKIQSEYVSRSGKTYYRQADAGEQVVSIYSIEGAITKADQYCGPSGTVTLMRDLMRNDKMDSVLGHLMEFDSGGGEATNIEEVSKFIRANIKKPVITHFNGLMCSAALGIGCAADEVYATLNTDVIGSVGVFMTIADWKAYFEKEGLVLHEIYATQSTNKNADFHEALKGNYEPIQKNLLDPFASSFIALVQQMRPATMGHPDIFTGKTYLAQDAQAKGLIDGLMTFGDAVQRVFQLADQRSANNPSFSNPNNLSMKIFGIEIGAKSEDGSYKLTAEQVTQLEAASAQANDNTTVIESLRQENKANADAINALTKRVEDNEKATAELQKWQSETPATAAAAPQGGGESQPEETKPWEEFNKTYAASYINKGIPR